MGGGGGGGRGREGAVGQRFVSSVRGEREREGTERGEEGGKLHCEVTATEAARPEHRSKREEEEEGS